MGKKLENAVWFIVENAPALLTVAFAAYVLVQSQRATLQVREILLWLLGIVGLLATSELIERFRRLRRIEEFSRKTLEAVQALAIPNAVSVYPRRIDATREIESIISTEREAISIIAGSLGGTSRLVPDLHALVDRASAAEGPQIRIFISHPSYMKQRAQLEGISSVQQRRRTLERLHNLLERTSIPLENIRLYKAVPTCSAVIAHAQRKLFLNPYTLGEPAENTLSLMVDGVTYAEAFEKFIKAHLEDPWDSHDLSISLEEFKNEQNAEIAKTIADQALEERSRRSQDRPVFVAINGCTAVGKSGLAKEIASYIKHGRREEVSCTLLETDGWITIGRKERMFRDLTGCDAESYDLNGLHETINRLSLRQEVSGQTYNHVKGFSEEVGTLDPGDIVIIDGLMSTHPTLHDWIDIYVWVECSADSHRRMRIERDVCFRGYTHDQAERNWEIHARAWPRFERICKPTDCFLLRANRTGMLLMDV